MKEKYATNIDGREWEIDLERERLVSLEDPKLVKRLSKPEIKQIRELIKKKNFNENNQ